MPTSTADDPLADLLPGLRASNPAARGHAARSVGRLGAAAVTAIPQLVAATNDQDRAVREAAAQAIAAVGPEAVPALVRLLSNVCKYVRRNAAWGLGKLGPQALAAVAPLCTALRDPDPRTASGAAQALGAMGEAAAAAVPRLAEAMRGTNVVLCRLAGKALSQIGPPALPALLADLRHTDRFVRGEAAVALGWMGPQAAAAVTDLINVVASSPAVEKALSGASVLDSRGVTPTAIAGAAGADDPTLLHAIQALGRIGPAARAALPVLTDVLADSGPAVREAAETAVRHIRGE